MTTTPEPICTDCNAERTVTVGLIARRDGTQAPINLVETTHAASCPVRRGATSLVLGGAV